MRAAVIVLMSLMLAATPLFSMKAAFAVESDGLIEGKDVFAARCSLCHQLPEPGMLKAKQWGLIIETMQQRMRQANIPQLNELEKKTILEFFSQQARQ